MNFKWYLPKFEDFQKKDGLELWESHPVEDYDVKYPGGPLAFYISKIKENEYEGYLRYPIIGSDKKLISVFSDSFENCYIFLIAKSIEKILQLQLTLDLRDELKTKEDILSLVNISQSNKVKRSLLW